MTFIPLLRIAGVLASGGLNALRHASFTPIRLWPAVDEVFNKPADELWDETTKAAAARARLPRVIEGRGLGPNERDAGWIDRDGDRWRYNHQADRWEYRLIRPDVDGGWLPVPTEPDGYTSAKYGPYIEVPDDGPPITPGIAAQCGPYVHPEMFSADGVADNMGSGPAAEGRAASAPAPSLARADAAQPTSLDARELRDAAYAIRGFAATSPVPEGWFELAAKISDAASQLAQYAGAK